MHRLLRLRFVRTRHNANSVAALVGAMEQAPQGAIWDLSVISPALLLASSDAPDFLAFSFMTRHVPEVAALVRKIKEQEPRTRLLGGGPHPSGDPDGTLAMGFDHVFVGEGEASLPSFLEEVAAGGSPKPKILAPRPRRLDLCSSFARRQGLLAPIELGRGCPHGCAYCQVPSLHGRRMRLRSVESALEHVAFAVQRGCTRTWFVIPDAFCYGSRAGGAGDRAAIERLLRGARELGMQHVVFGDFPGEVRPEHVRPELVELVARLASNRSVVIGGQSGSDRILRQVHRGHDAAAIGRAAGVVRSFGLVPHVDFILGFPGETRDDRLRTLGLVDELVERHQARARFHSFMPLPGTPLAGCAPSALEDDVLARVERLTGRGHADGDWRRQGRRSAVEVTAFPGPTK